ncbi:methylosome protein WDR77-like [Choristoneura fumiferana]|uniref:methylosome protein WDR77-like n=1 Tax=Choristoneura fumiferana TaxID=7141 RepID=UPI003D15C0CE
MENSNKIVPPHLNAEVYRTDTTGNEAPSYLDYIKLHPDGSVLVGCSELTGRYWSGGAAVFRSISEAQEINPKSMRSIQLDYGSADGCFVGSSSKVLICDDSGALSIWSINENEAWKQWKDEATVAEHDSMIMAVDCLEAEKQYVTAGADSHIKVWDLSDMICIRNYSLAHSATVSDVSVRPKSTTSFASGSLDMYVTLWDDNIDKPVLDLVKNDCGIRCLQWFDENQLVYGDDAGVLRVVDARQPETVTTLCDFPAPVHKIAVQPDTGRIAVCCDNKIVSVCEKLQDKSRVMYHDRHLHSNYVRGVAWDTANRNVLYSSAWDGHIRTHNIA